MTFKMVSFATFSFKEGATFCLDHVAINSRKRQPSHANESANNFNKSHVRNHVSQQKNVNI